jgi:UDP-3-O-[3-hydroxymyristoyl] glucosamine N-acyltransferase
MPQTLKQLAGALGLRLRGDEAIVLHGVASLDSATPADLAFVEDEANLARALDSAAGALVVGEFAFPADVRKPFLIGPHPRLAFARAARLLLLPRPLAPGVHPTAVIGDSVYLGVGVCIDAHAFIGEAASLGDGVSVGPGASIGPGVSIGQDSDIRANVVIYPGTRLGRRVIVHAGAVLGSDGFGYVRDPETGRYEKFPQKGTLEIGDEVEIGANATLDRGALDATVIGRGVKLDNLVHVGHNVRIGENVVIAAQTGISGSVVIADNVVIAGQVGIGDRARVEEGAILGAQCGVPSEKIVRGKGVLFWGTPARPIREYLKGLAVLARLARKER